MDSRKDLEHCVREALRLTLSRLGLSFGKTESWKDGNMDLLIMPVIDSDMAYPLEPRVNVAVCCESHTCITWSDEEHLLVKGGGLGPVSQGRFADGGLSPEEFIKTLEASLAARLPSGSITQ